MLIVTGKIPLRRRPQIFNDHAAIDAALVAQRERHDHWVRHLMDDLTSAIRKIAGRKPS
jgi:hypothetical protein